MAIVNTQGFIIDAPNVSIETKDNNYISLTASSGQLSITNSTLDIKGGQGVYKLLSVETEKVIKVTLTDAQFDGNMMALWGAEQVVGKDTFHMFDEKFIVGEKTANKVEINRAGIKVDTLSIGGWEKVASNPAKGQYSATYNDVSGVLSLTFSPEDEKAEIQPIYEYETEAVSYNFLNNAIPKRGKVYLQFPVYEDEDGNATTERTAQIDIYRASISANATIGGSYKTASTFTVELEAEDAKRPDKKVWAIKILKRKDLA